MCLSKRQFHGKINEGDDDMKKMLLVDGNSMLFRGYYATIYTRPMKTSKGIPTNAVYAFATMFQKAVEIIQPEAVLVAFDAGKSTFRHELFTEYKGGRKETPEDLIPQFSIVRDYLDAIGAKRYELPQIEADDLIGTMVKKYPDWQIDILSSDRDLLQLIDKTTSVLLMKKGISELEEMTENGLMEFLGITPQQIPDLKGLMGDASDNIPGIPSVGEKTALKLLKDYGSVEKLLESTESLRGKLKEKVEEFADQARLSKILATIKTDVELNIEASDCLFVPQVEQVIQFFTDYEMQSLAKKFQSQKVETNPTKEVKKSVEVICPKSFFDGPTAIALDFSSEDFYQSQFFGITLTQGKEVVYLSVDDFKKDQDLLSWLKSQQLKVIYDAKRAYREFKRLNIPINGMDFDVMIAAFLCDSNLTTWDRLKQSYNFNEKYTLVDVYGTEAKPKLPDFQEQLHRATELALFTWNLYEVCKDKINEYEMNELFVEIEMPLVKILFDMEEEGITIDRDVLDDIAMKTLNQLNELTQKIYSYVDEEFNIKSPKQLAEVLFDKLGLMANKKRSTSVDVLEKLQGMHPIIDDLMDYRKLQKLYSTYAEGLKKYIQSDGKIHTIYHQCSTQTGRLSSTDPNMQNISIRDEQSREIRKAFIPTAGNVLLAADYSQVELRVLAHMANEEGLMQAFRENLDIHTKTAMDIFNVSSEKVTSLMRRDAKAVNFGVVYGISDFGLSEQLGISRKDAKHYIDTYFAKYPRIKDYMDGVIEQCQENGYVTTLLNRRREIHEIHDKNHMVREFGKRAAMNAPIQGSAADLIKLAMIKVQKLIDVKGLKSKMILQVHDELIFDVLQSEVDEMKVLIEEGMTKAMDLKVPLVAECQQGKTWYDAK